MIRAVLLTLVCTAGCVGPPATWDDAVPAIRPLGPIRSQHGLVIVRTVEMAPQPSAADRYHRGFRVLDPDGHEVHRELAFSEDWATVRLFPGRYIVVSFVGEGLFDRHWERAQILVAAGEITAVDFMTPRSPAVVP